MKNVFLYLIILLPGVIFSQPDLKFVRYNTENGLANDDVLSICQDHFGFMWFGTKDGCSRFDGMKFKTYQYQENQSGSISQGWVNGIVRDKQDNLWFAFSGTGSPIMKYDYKKDVFVDMSKQFKEHMGTNDEDLNCWTMFCDSKGLIWMQLKDVIQYNPETGEIVNLSQKHELLNNIAVKGFFEDANENIWILGGNAIVYNSKTKSLISIEKGTGDNMINAGVLLSGYQDSEKDIMIGSRKGLFKLTSPIKESARFENIKHEPGNTFSLSNNIVYCFDQFDEHNLLIGTANGLNILDKQEGKIYRYYNDEIDPESINSNLIRAVYKDKHNTIWIGTSAGVGKMQTKNFKSYSQSLYKNSLSHNKVQCVCKGPDSEVWIGTPKGIDIFNRETGKFRFFTGITNNLEGLHGAPLAMHYTADNGTWVGTWAGGFSHISNKGEITNYVTKESLQHIRHAFSIFQDSKKNLWIGVSSRGNMGVYVYDSKNDSLRKYTSNESETSLLSDRISYITEDSEGQIWIGTWMGLNRLTDIDKGTFARYLEDNHVIHITESSDKNLWIGTKNGLFKFIKEKGQFIKYNGKDRLPGSHIMGILEDQSANIWISTNKGLARLNPNNEKNPDITVFRKDEGIRIGDFSPASCVKMPDGTMFFGGTKGICMFHPEKIGKDTIAPNIVLTNLKIANQTVKVGDTINNQVVLPQSISTLEQLVLNHKNNDLAIEFAGLQYNMPQYNQYAYTLDGYGVEDSSWNYTNAGERNVKYMNLPAGDYVFKVKAANNYGIWNEKPAVLNIKILPPWWETWWFRISVFLFLATGITSLYFYRINALKRQKRILEKKVAERTSELREANSQLEEKQEEILQQNEEIISVNETLKYKNEQIKAKNEEIEAQKEEVEASRDQLEKAFNNITVISEFGQKITSTFDFDTINKMIFDYVSSLMDTSAFGIGIYNEKRKIIDFPYFMEDGKPTPYFFKDLESEKSLSVRCFKNKEEIFINDLSREYQKYLGELPEVQTSELPSSVIHLPLIVEDRPIGTITVNSFKKNAYNHNDLANLRTLASYISIALDNSKAYRIIRSKNEQISGSIRYGQTIQQAMLPPKKQLDNYFENFVIFRPKDIVSGDFYWFASIKNLEGFNSDKQRNLQGFDNGLDSNGYVETRHVEDPGQVGALSLLAVVDCTGHGVPGAFMSMIGSRLLNDIVIERKIYSPAKILDELNKMVRKALRQDVTDNHDGMDLCLCKFQQTGEKWELTYAGAKRSLIFYNSETNSIEELPGTRKSIGGITARNKVIEFSEIKHTVGHKDIFYLSTDGLIDQCNPKKRKFSQKRLVELIKEIHHLPSDEQKQILEKELDTFQAGFEQRDDITIAGIRLKT